MKSAKRMVLVPEDAMRRYEQRQRFETPPIVSSLMDADIDMTDILQRTDIPDGEKQKLYAANLERFLDLKRQKDGQIPTVRIASKEEKPSLSTEKIIEHIPKTMRTRAAALVSKLKARPDVISWDQTERVKIEGQTIPNSNISDLVSNAMRERKNFNPVGSREFFRTLNEINVPRDLIRNEGKRKQTEAISPEPSGTLREEGSALSKFFDNYMEERRKSRRQAPRRWLKY